MRFTVKFDIDIDVDGWAKARGIGAGAALTEALTYIKRASDPTEGGQDDYLTLAGPVEACMDLGNLGEM